MHQARPDSPIYAIIKSGKYPLIPDGHCCHSLVGPGAVGFNAGHLWHVDGTRPESVADAMVQGRKMAEQYRDALAEFAPAAFGNAFLAYTGALMGIRETRRIVGDYEITLEDFMKRQTFDDEICRNSYFIDVHPGVKQAVRDMKDAGKIESEFIRYDAGLSHGIPYRCLTPKGLTNVIVAGRSISCEQIVQGSVRLMPCCQTMGEAAGAAAAQAVGAARLGAPVNMHTIDVDRLRTRLREAGAYLP